MAPARSACILGQVRSDTIPGHTTHEPKWCAQGAADLFLLKAPPNGCAQVPKGKQAYGLDTSKPPKKTSHTEQTQQSRGLPLTDGLAAQVHAILRKIVAKTLESEDCKGLAQFTHLQRDIARNASEALDVMRLEAKRMVTTMVEMERSYLTAEVSPACFA